MTKKNSTGSERPELKPYNNQPEDGLTDDQRVSREKPGRQDGARVQPGPEDKKRGQDS